MSLNALGTIRIESIKELPATHTNLTVYDADGKYAPVLLVKTNIIGLGFQNINRPTKQAATYDAKKGKYYFIMNDNQRVVRITHDEYEPLEIRFLADYNLNVDSGKVYEVVLKEGEIKYSEVEFKITPEDADLIIDNESIKARKIKLQNGNYQIQIKKPGYETISRTLDIKSDRLYFDFNLAKVPKVIVQKEENKKDNVTSEQTNLALLFLLIMPPVILVPVSIFKKDKFRSFIGRFGLFIILWIIVNFSIYMFFPDFRIYFVNVYNYFQAVLKTIF